MSARDFIIAAKTEIHWNPRLNMEWIPASVEMTIQGPSNVI